MMIFKTTLLSFGGMLKPIEDTTSVDLDKKNISIQKFGTFNLEQTYSPFYKKTGRDFYKQIFITFSIPSLVSLAFMFFGMKLILFASKPLWWKAFFLLSPIFAIAYVIYSIKSAERRKEIHKHLNKIYFIPYGMLILSIISFQEGFVLTALLFSAFSLFIAEEYLLKDLFWMLRKGDNGTRFWKIQDQDDDILPKEEKPLPVEVMASLKKFLIISGTEN